MVYWFPGLLVYWFIGSPVYWFTGLLVHWFTGSLVYWCTGTHNWAPQLPRGVPQIATKSASQALPKTRQESGSAANSDKICFPSPPQHVPREQEYRKYIDMALIWGDPTKHTRKLRILGSWGAGITNWRARLHEAPEARNLVI